MESLSLQADKGQYHYQPQHKINATKCEWQFDDIKPLAQNSTVEYEFNVCPMHWNVTQNQPDKTSQHQSGILHHIQQFQVCLHGQKVPSQWVRYSSRSIWQGAVWSDGQSVLDTEFYYVPEKEIQQYMEEQVEWTTVGNLSPSPSNGCIVKIY